ncbi:MAG: RnfABCDGE type electron transport complex subunit D, partial [Bacteroidales bacterium]
AIALILGGVYMLARRIISWHIPVSFLASAAVFAAIFWQINPEVYADPLFHMLAGGMMLGAIYMATDYSTSPMAPGGMIIFGVGCGLLTMIIRLFGAYPEGVAFSILIMNSFVPLINRAFKPKRFGEEIKNG